MFYDISCQSRVTAALSSIATVNCYGSIAHVIVSLVSQVPGVPIERVESMLTAIKNMRYFLRTAYGDSKRFAGTSIDIKFSRPVSR